MSLPSQATIPHCAHTRGTTALLLKAREHLFPADYIAELGNIVAVQDGLYGRG